MACGSTIGPILASGLGCRTVDVGAPQVPPLDLCMHSGLRAPCHTDEGAPTETDVLGQRRPGLTHVGIANASLQRGSLCAEAGYIVLADCSVWPPEDCCLGTPSYSAREGTPCEKWGCMRSWQCTASGRCAQWTTCPTPTTTSAPSSRTSLPWMPASMWMTCLRPTSKAPSQTRPVTTYTSERPAGTTDAPSPFVQRGEEVQEILCSERRVIDEDWRISGHSSMNM